jgi:hypothetical protein
MTQNNSGSGITFSSALLLLFIGLKLGKVIDWGWVWILGPLWIVSALWIIFCLFIIVGGITMRLYDKIDHWIERRSQARIDALLAKLDD